MGELRLMKGNEAIAEAAIRVGCDGYFGYPITPQSEVMETLMARKPWETTGMVVLQAESEIASIHMLYGAASCGKKVMTSSSSPGISLMMEGVSYLAGSELPCVIMNCSRGGPGLGTIQPGQADYFQSTKGGGHGDYNLLVLAPASVQEMFDFVGLGFDLAFKYRNPVLILTDGVIGQMMEKVELSEQQKRWTAEEIEEKWGTWATNGKKTYRERHITTSLEFDSAVMEARNHHLQAKYRQMEAEDTRWEEIQCEDAEYLFVAYGSSSRICQKAIQIARANGIKAGLFRPITLFPFPSQRIAEISKHIKGILSVEMSAGQMIQDIRLAVEGRAKVAHYGRFGGIIPTPLEIVNALETKIIKGE
jgi:2-oxoglutarate/2-oxoacid ferredoxin oxidoreductase subunit alpha